MWLVWLWDTWGRGIFLTGQEAEKMSNITSTLPSSSTCMYLGVPITHSLIDWIIPACRAQ